jgi:tryptophanyl-tRNA synthetase
MILVEPEALLTEAARMPGLDGAKMSKSYGNFIALREAPDSVTKKVRAMPTDPARVRRTDPGDPQKCPVWSLHQIYSDDACRAWASAGCQSAGIGCVDCKQPVIDGILKEQAPILERAEYYQNNPALVRNILNEGCARARELARETLRDVREAMGV